ncbi:hypothetical protein DL98DRAFT_658069 [Cadophora sp. DSE1049]|nr:hypothetical protein DL98DRAFT_658069 [Cadophora sp. DSE1049]
MASSGLHDGTCPVGVHKPHWEILELDHPDHVECYYCQALHSENDLLARCNLKCRKLNHKVRTAEFIHPDFDMIVFRLVMKQHRQGSVNENLLKLLSYRSKPVIEGSQVKRIIAEPRIVDGSLLMHVQTIYVVPTNRPSQKFLLDRNLLKCPHSLRWGAKNIRVTGLLNRRFKALTRGTVPMAIGSRECIGSSRCVLCPTEFDVSLERFEGQGEGGGILLFIDKWQDLGDGLSPLEADYSRAVGQRDKYRAIRGPKVMKKLSYESPRARFNEARASSDEVALAALTYEDRWELFDVDSSRWVKFLRTKEKNLWPLFGCGQPYPHNYIGTSMDVGEGRARETGELAAKTENIASH